MRGWFGRLFIHGLSIVTQKLIPLPRGQRYRVTGDLNNTNKTERSLIPHAFWLALASTIGIAKIIDKKGTQGLGPLIPPLLFIPTTGPGKIPPQGTEQPIAIAELLIMNEARNT
jgi:hypothetical protein